jgi:hypothetical protein
MTSAPVALSIVGMINRFYKAQFDRISPGSAPAFL